MSPVPQILSYLPKTTQVAVKTAFESANLICELNQETDVDSVMVCLSLQSYAIFITDQAKDNEALKPLVNLLQDRYPDITTLYLPVLNTDKNELSEGCLDLLCQLVEQALTAYQLSRKDWLLQLRFLQQHY